MSRDVRVFVEHDLPARGVAIHVGLDHGEVLNFDMPNIKMVRDGERSDAMPLLLADDVARALYAALAEHYGHSGHDTRALRRDYDHERARVDKLMDHLIGPGR